MFPGFEDVLITLCCLDDQQCCTKLAPVNTVLMTRIFLHLANQNSKCCGKLHCLSFITVSDSLKRPSKQFVIAKCGTSSGPTIGNVN